MNRNSGNDKKLQNSKGGRSGGSKGDNPRPGKPSTRRSGPRSEGGPEGGKRERPNLKFKGGTNQRKSYGSKRSNVEGAPRKPGGKSENRRGPRPESGSKQGWIWGLHAGQAVLDNPSRTVHQVMMSENVAKRWNIDPAVSTYNGHRVSIVHPRDIDGQLGSDTVHQGLAVKAAPLNEPDLKDVLSAEDGLILVLDQVTDPHNVGAMFRLCAAFGAKALIMQSRNAPPLTGATAKVAVGTLETVPCILVTNIANTLLEMQKEHWSVIGLAGDTDLTLQTAISQASPRKVIVMGAEGPGLRTRVRDSCDMVAKIPMPGGAESLNVSTAAAIAIYEAVRE